jgi:DNA-binding LacI/PurR family transcriptional regulator
MFYTLSNRLLKDIGMSEDRRKKIIRLKDIAERAGVSIATASRVINNSGIVSKEIKRKVLGVIEELGYHPNAIARSLATKKTGNIGVLISKTLNPLPLDPFYSVIFQSIENTFKEEGYSTVFSTISNHKDDYKFKIFSENRVDGFILLGCEIEEKLISFLKEKNFPTVLVDNHIDEIKMNTVVIDNEQGAKELVEYLINLGHTKIGYICERLDNLSFYERFLGYKRALEKYNIEYKPKLIQEGGRGAQGGYVAMTKLLDESEIPTAVFAGNDTTAIGAMKAIVERGLRVPDDISLAGFDGLEIYSHIHPSLTTVKVYRKEMGEIAARLLLKTMKNPEYPSLKCVVSTSLIRGESTIEPRKVEY